MKQSSHSWKRKTGSSYTDESRLTRKEAADYLGVTEGTLSVWASTKRYSLPYYQIGRKCFYLKCDLDAHIESKMRGQAA